MCGSLCKMTLAIRLGSTPDTAMFYLWDFYVSRHGLLWETRRFTSRSAKSSNDLKFPEYIRVNTLYRKLESQPQLEPVPAG